MGLLQFSNFKPNTSFDSPSVKSNEAPLAFASVEGNQIMGKGQDGKISHRCSCAIIPTESAHDTSVSRPEKRKLPVSLRTALSVRLPVAL